MAQVNGQEVIELIEEIMPPIQRSDAVCNIHMCFVNSTDDINSVVFLKDLQRKTEVYISVDMINSVYNGDEALCRMLHNLIVLLNIISYSSPIRANTLTIVLQNKSLRKLFLNNHIFSAECLETLSIGLQNNTSLKNLFLSESNIGNIGANFIANALKINKTLRKLTIENNNISFDGAEFLARALQYNTSLTTLNISNNNIGDRGAEAIANALDCNTTLLRISLGNNNIGPDGAEFLASALHNNARLIDFDINYNNIGDVGAEAFALALRINKSITSIHMSVNNISIVGFTSLASAVSSNTTLLNISIYEVIHRIPREITNTIKKIQIRNEAMRQLQLWSPWVHLSFPMQCHPMVMSTLLCNEETSNENEYSNSLRLPSQVWMYIFSFLQRQQFY